MADYFLYHNVEKDHASKTCLYFNDETYTYADAVRLSNKCGNLLREFGVRQEDRILIALKDCPQFVWTWFGAARIGAVITMVNPLLPVEDYRYYLHYTRATAAIIDSSLVGIFDEAANDAQDLRQVFLVNCDSNEKAADDTKDGVDGEARIASSFDQLLAEMPDACLPADTHRDDPAIWLFTSGSTGHPKAAVHLQHDLPYNTEMYAKRTLGINENDLTVAVPKLFFGYATGTNLLFPFSVGGATALFSERSTPEKIFEMIRRFKPSVLTNVPTMINMMLNHERATDADLSSLRLSLSAGEALPPELYERWMKRFGVEILDGIGSAEMFHIYITNRSGDVKLGSLGKIVEGYEARIIDAEGSEAQTGEMGTLRVKGDSAALCYWQAHEKSKETFAGDWCTTGDQFHKDADGYFWYHGRTDDMLKVSGIYVAPTEIENCLLQHEAVQECAVIGVNAGDGLIKTKAFIVARENFTADDKLARDIQEFAKRTIAVYKYPRLIEFVESLPKNDRGKIDRKKLKEQKPEARIQESE